MVRKLGGRVFAGFYESRRWRDFRNGGDGEADRPAGPRRAQDSRQGGRPRRWKARVSAGPGVGSAGGIRGTCAEGERGDGDQGLEGGN
jgi:hypothetical protein